MKLLNKTLRSYIIYSFSILLVTIPLFYFTVKSVLLHSVDRSLRTQLHDIRSNLYTVQNQDELAAWSKLDKDITLAPSDEIFRDDIYTVYHENKRHRDQDPYREIAGTINVGGKNYKLIISSSLVENEDLLGSILIVQTILLILLMAGMLWINQIISKKIWQPFYVALNNMQQYELSKNTSLAFKQSGTDEFNELNKAMKNLFDRNYEIYLQQKEFTENASHEMQTPLAIFQGKLELLMQTTPLNEDQAALISELEDTNLRLVRLNKSLLLLAKIENNQYTQTEVVNVTALTKKLVSQLGDYAGRHKITTIIENYADDLIIKANNSLIEILINNLLSNAIRHNVHDGKIIIEINKNQLQVKNTGQPAALNDQKVFNRFHKESSNTGSENTGLGLALVKKICSIYKYEINYTFSEGIHCFELTF